MADKSQKLAPKGYVPLRALCIELAAGGVERENIENVSKKLIQFVSFFLINFDFSVRKNLIGKVKIMLILSIGLFMFLYSLKFIIELYRIHFFVMKIHLNHQKNPKNKDKNIFN